MTWLNTIELIVLWIFALSVKLKCELITNKNELIICSDCPEMLKANTCNIPFCTLDSKCEKSIIDINNFTANDNNGLKLVCRDEYSLTFKWNPNAKEYFFMKYSKEGSNEWWFTNLTRCNFQTIVKLVPNKRYEIQLYSFSLTSKILFRSQKVSEYTTKLLAPRTSVKDLNYTLQLESDTYTATVTWKPGTDLSCRYFVQWDQKKRQPGSLYHRIINLKMRPISEFNKSDLEFGKKYVFSIRSVNNNGEKESGSRSLDIVIPSCLDTYKNLSICPPDMPRNLTIQYLKTETDVNGTNIFSNIKLSWNKPKFQPNYYTAIINKLDLTSDNFTTLSSNISGINHFALFEHIDPRINTRIKLTAYSDGGASKPAYAEIYYQKNNNVSNYGKPLWIWITSLLGIILLALLFVFRAKIRNFIFKQLDIKQIRDEAIVKYVVSDNEDPRWELNEIKLTVNQVIGVGAFGIVQKGWYCLEPNKKSEVAVKMLKARPTEEQITQFYNEIEIMKSVPRHPHIVFLIGVITKSRSSNPLMLVEYCAKGDLQTFLRNVWLVLGDSNSKNTSAAECSDNCTKFSNKFYDMEDSCLLKKEYVLQSKDLLSFARQILIGMEFLSSLKMIHRDLAARNILLNDHYTIKISDFGLCRDIYTNNVYQKVTGGKLPFRWMALESLTHQIYTTESDVWSFGIVMWEIVTLGGNPFPTVKTEDLIPLLKGNYRMKNPINCSEEVYNIMLRCWKAHPSQRPTFTELRETFDKLLESEMQYISLEDARKLDLNYYENIRNSLAGVSLTDRYIVQSNKNNI